MSRPSSFDRSHVLDQVFTANKTNVRKGFISFVSVNIRSDMSQLKVVTSSCSFNSQIKGQTRRMQATLDSLKIPYFLVDISENTLYRKLAHGDVPAIFVNEEFIGNFEDFECAVDGKVLLEFLRIIPPEPEFAPSIMAS